MGIMGVFLLFFFHVTEYDQQMLNHHERDLASEFMGGIVFSGIPPA